LKKQLLEKLKKYPKFTGVFSVSAEVLCGGSLVPFCGKPLEKPDFPALSAVLPVPYCVVLAFPAPGPRRFAKTRKRGADGLQGGIPQRFDPPPGALET